jgi:hypothetical protein
MDKIDYKKALYPLYQPSTKEVTVVEVPTMHFLMLDGQGDPGTSAAFSAGMETLFALSYTLKFMIKKGPLALDYGVMPPEGLWWADDMAVFPEQDKAHWQWTIMIMQPECITPDLVEAAVIEVRRKKNPALLQEVRFAPFSEGICAQVMHIGPFSEEGPTIERVHAFIAASGRTMVGKHHEIYLSDIRRANPAKWKTIIRQPMG